MSLSRRKRLTITSNPERRSITVRLRRLRQVLRDASLDAMLVSALPDVRYLSGFTGSNALCVITARRKLFVTDSRYLAQSRDEVPGWKRRVTAAMLVDEVGRSGVLNECRNLGFDPDATPYSTYRRIRRLLRGMNFVPLPGIIEAIAVQKDAGEIRAIRRAVDISDRTFAAVLPMIKPGIAELEIAAEISYHHRMFGAEGDAFDAIVASGPRAALPHARASGKRIKKGELVILDFGCTFLGYGSDLTRTVAVGRPTERARKMYEVVREAQETAIAAARGGMMARELDGIARRVIDRAGLGDCFLHSLGHGLGLRVHERPRVSALSNDRLAANSVITIEPGVYVPGFGGIRIEDDVLLEPAGCRVLNRSPKELLVV